MGLFDKLRDPIFLKESSSAQRQLEQLKAINREQLTDKQKNELDREIKLISLGIKGENAIEFEFSNSHIPLYILHDLYFKCNGLSAQIDYMVISRKHIWVIECKNLYGDIEITAKGDFIRTINSIREGTYSPITQNQRHLDLVKELRIKSKSNIVTKFLSEINFVDVYRSIIVLSNPKTIINDKFAEESVRKQVIRADGLISYIKKMDDDSNTPQFSDKSMKAFADFYLNHHIESETDYASEFFARSANGFVPNKPDNPNDNPFSSSGKSNTCPECGAQMVLRTAQKGDKAGQQFWGCSAFPKCKYVAKSLERPINVISPKELDRPNNNVPAPPLEKSNTCPNCGAPMVLRTAQKGDNAGQQFWGCSSFPKCKCSIPFEEIIKDKVSCDARYIRQGQS